MRAMDGEKNPRKIKQTKTEFQKKYTLYLFAHFIDKKSMFI
jgi:hypothetical protein